MEEKDEYLDKLLKECGRINADKDYNINLLSRIHRADKAEKPYQEKIEKKILATREIFSFYNKTTGLSFVTSGIALIALNIWGSEINEIIFLLKDIALNFNNILR